MALPQDHVRAMDQLRSRLSQLSTAIVLMQQGLAGNDPLPPWPVLQQASISVGANMEELATVLGQQRQLFTSLHPYPLPNFPGHKQEVLLQQLLRKKLDPKAEDWIEESLHTGDKEDGGAVERDGAVDDEDLRGLWEWAGTLKADMIKRLWKAGVFMDNYTIQERGGIEKVINGIRDLDDSEDKDVDEGNKMEEDPKPAVDNVTRDSGLDISKPPVPLVTLLKFASGADVPGL